MNLSWFYGSHLQGCEPLQGAHHAGTLGVASENI